VLLTRSPLTNTALGRQLKAVNQARRVGPFDLHVSGTPPAFILSQDQTLRREFSCLEPLAVHASYHSSVVKVRIPPPSITHPGGTVKRTEARTPQFQYQYNRYSTACQVETVPGCRSGALLLSCSVANGRATELGRAPLSPATKQLVSHKRPTACCPPALQPTPSKRPAPSSGRWPSGSTPRAGPTCSPGPRTRKLPRRRSCSVSPALACPGA
jgi:hypothetical protein